MYKSLFYFWIKISVIDEKCLLQDIVYNGKFILLFIYSTDTRPNYKILNFNELNGVYILNLDQLIINMKYCYFEFLDLS